MNNSDSGFRFRSICMNLKKEDIFMKIGDILKPENVTVIDSVKHWKSAVEVATKPLIDQGYITHEYTDAIIDNAQKYNAYFVLCPGFALLHAESSRGVIETQLSVTLSMHPFKFPGKDDEVQLMITLAAKDNSEHMEVMQSIAMLLADEEKFKALLRSSSADNLYKLLTA